MDSCNSAKEKSKNLEKVWDTTYEENSPKELGWYEEVSEPSLTLIKKYLKEREKTILDAGCGESTLIQSLLDDGYKNLIGIDISSRAIKFLKDNTVLPQGATLELQSENLTAPLRFKNQGGVWHDRAVFHFLQESSEQESYKKNLHNFLEEDGIFIIACFSDENSAEMCNGFPVRKYNLEDLKEIFSDEFKFEESLYWDYIMPWGDIRKYIYAVFSKK